MSKERTLVAWADLMVEQDQRQYESSFIEPVAIPTEDAVAGAVVAALIVKEALPQRERWMACLGRRSIDLAILRPEALAGRYRVSCLSSGLRNGVMRISASGFRLGNLEKSDTVGTKPVSLAKPIDLSKPMRLAKEAPTAETSNVIYLQAAE